MNILHMYIFIQYIVWAIVLLLLHFFSCLNCLHFMPFQILMTHNHSLLLSLIKLMASCLNYRAYYQATRVSASCKHEKNIYYFEKFSDALDKFSFDKLLHGQKKFRDPEY